MGTKVVLPLGGQSGFCLIPPGRTPIWPGGKGNNAPLDAQIWNPQPTRATPAGLPAGTLAK